MKPDYPRALEFFRRACEGNHAQGCHNLAAMYHSPDRTHGFTREQRLKLMIDNAEKACGLGYSDSCLGLKNGCSQGYAPACSALERQQR